MDSLFSILVYLSLEVVSLSLEVVSLSLEVATKAKSRLLLEMMMGEGKNE